MLSCQFLVIGAGETGMFIAFSLAKQGLEVILVEENEIGGSYLYSKEVPKKKLQEISYSFFQILQTFRDHTEFLPYLDQSRQLISRQIYQEIRYQAAKVKQKLKNFNNLKVIYGKASFQSKRLVEVQTKEDRHIISFENCVIAVGKNQMNLPKIKGLEEIDFLYQHNVFFAEKIPRELAVIGCSLENLEVAALYANLGVKVKLFEANYVENILKNLDPSSLNYFFQRLLEKNVEFFFGAKITKIKQKETNKILLYDEEKNEYEVSHLYIKVKENFEDNLNLGKIGIQHNKNGIITTASGQTIHRNIWALGNCNTNSQNLVTQINNFLEKNQVSRKENKTSNSRGLVLLSSVSSIIGSDGLKPLTFSVNIVSDVYPICSLGLTYQQAVAKLGPQIKFEIYKINGLEGFFKIVYNEINNQILGLSMAGQVCNNLCTNGILALVKAFSVREFLDFLQTLYNLEKI